MPVRRTLLARPVLEAAPALLGTVLSRTTDEGTVAVRITEVEAYDGPNDPGSHAYRGQTARNAVMFGPPGFLYVYFTYGMHFCMNISAGPDGQPAAVLLRAGEVIDGIDLARARRGATPAATPPATSSVAPPAGPPADTRGGSPTDSSVGPPAGAPVGPSVGSPAASSVGAPGDSPAGLPVGSAAGALVGPSAAPPGDSPAGPPVGRARRIADRDLARGPARLCVALGITRDANGADLLSRTSAIRLLTGTPFTGTPATGPRVGLREAADRPWRFWIPGEPSVSPYKPHVPKRR